MIARLLLSSILLMVAGCYLPAIEAGHEGVLVKKPILFGHGGVDPVPMSTGRSGIALTTEVIEMDLRPRQSG